MKKILWVLLLLVGVSILEIGCQQGVTDVGNPSINQPIASPNSVPPPPTVSQLMGGYLVPSADAASTEAGPGGGSPPPALAIPACKTDPLQSPSIAVTSNPTQIVLSHFLYYGTGTQNILASYDAKTGAIAFELSDPAVAIKSCTGTAGFVNNNVTVTLQCKPTGSSGTDCQSQYEKGSIK